MDAAAILKHLTSARERLIAGTISLDELIGANKEATAALLAYIETLEAAREVARKVRRNRRRRELRAERKRRR